jgi:hypothetical protein
MQHAWAGAKHGCLRWRAQPIRSIVSVLVPGVPSSNHALRMCSCVVARHCQKLQLSFESAVAVCAMLHDDSAGQAGCATASTFARSNSHIWLTSMIPTYWLPASLPLLLLLLLLLLVLDPGASKRWRAVVGVHHAILRTGLRHPVRVLRDSRTTAAAAATAAAAFGAAGSCRRQQQRPSSSSRWWSRQQRQQQQCSGDTCRRQDAQWLSIRSSCVWLESVNAAAALVRSWGGWGSAAAITKHTH